MSAEENIALVRRFYEEVWVKGNPDGADVFAEDYVRHDLRGTAATPGPEGQRRIARDFHAAFPDLHFQVDLILAQGELVAARWTSAGTNTGSWGSVSPTGRFARFSGVNIFRLRDGKVVEIWNHRDDLALMQQLDAPVFGGAVPDPGRA
ncbi:ester cyclase [Streptomyces sp. NPDC050658]|uniref:ester cyclase n=1 Tax=unclassified Streptomyces TaxID=2593676 RepID=UPI0034125143